MWASVSSSRLNTGFSGVAAQLSNLCRAVVMPLFAGQLAVKGCQTDSKCLQGCERVGKVHGEFVLVNLHPSGTLGAYKWCGRLAMPAAAAG